ncbi:MAG TPA: two-component sensor histidine kinase [Nitrospiraceae bacterium]|nr:two-component sensor histidine kinase [Nitrospiraceae bacterium]
MKIERKIILYNIFNVALILLIGFFAFQNLNLMLTKLKFVEIADDMNTAFLEMRLSEKNYFLYNDRTALDEIKEKIDQTTASIEQVKADIVKAIGETDINTLKSHLNRYSALIGEVRQNGNNRDVQMGLRLRDAGKKLREFSESMTKLERKRVNEIIEVSKKILFSSFWVVLAFAIAVSHFISQRILKSLRKIETLAASITEGKFATIQGIRSKDEFDSVISAINTMSEELRNREEQIIQSKKLASLGILTAGVAHELTNPINNISMIAQAYEELYDKLSRKERVEFMNKVEGETERMRSIVKNLLDFSRPKKADMKEADINVVMQKAFKLVQNMLEVSNVDAKLNLMDGLNHVFIDEDQIKQVLVNLITNAVQAMHGGGRLFISTRTGKNKDSVEITVRDTGKGIPPEFLPHVFDPFFTTKGEGGTGLGLSVSYGIIKNHKGDIRVESWIGEGTTFTIELPVYTEAGDALIHEGVK